MSGHIRTVLGDREPSGTGVVYGHEHLILDSPLIEDRFPHILLNDVDAAIEEVSACAAAGAVLMVDAMPMSAGRDAVRLAEIARRTNVDIISATGLHHDRYYGPQHWTNRVAEDELIELMTADLLEGIDEFDYTGPIIRRSSYRAGIVKVATSGPTPDRRDLRHLRVSAIVSKATGAPILTHCEGGKGGMLQIEQLLAHGVPASAIILSHVDKAHDIAYLTELADAGVVLELDQSLREWQRGRDSITVRAICALAEHDLLGQVIVGTDGARRSLWRSLGGSPGLEWLADSLPIELRKAGLSEDGIAAVMGDNARRALTWRPAS